MQRLQHEKSFTLLQHRQHEELAVFLKKEVLLTSCGERAVNQADLAVERVDQLPSRSPRRTCGCRNDPRARLLNLPAQNSTKWGDHKPVQNVAPYVGREPLQHALARKVKKSRMRRQPPPGLGTAGRQEIMAVQLGCGVREETFDVCPTLDGPCLEEDNCPINLSSRY